MIPETRVSAEAVCRPRSLALLLALLSLPRLKPVAPRSILFVPHASLAAQYLSWAHALFPPSTLDPSLDPLEDSAPPDPYTPSAPLSSIFQTLIRPPDSHTSSDAVSLRQATETFVSDPPHVLVATPTRLNDLLLADRNPRPLHRLLARTPLIAMDEVDSLLSLPAGPSTAAQTPRETDKEWKKWLRHVPPVLGCIERIRLAKEELLTQSDLQRSPAAATEEMRFAMVTASDVSPVEQWAKERSGWFDRPQDLDVLDYASPDARPQDESVRHHAVVVREDGSLANLDPLTSSLSPPPVPSAHDAAGSPVLIEAIATIFALSLPSPESASSDSSIKALLVVPPSFSSQRVVAALRSLGVPARPLLPSDASLVEPADGDGADEPELLVASSSFARGIDVPSLTHVFLAHIPATHGEYVHLAGRVGRMGAAADTGEGRVISFVGDGDATGGRLVKLMGEAGVRLERMDLGSAVDW